ncbi:hypothetical protein VTL71DRAFT_16550 [Oculimacula yallundae]|uniref:Uncharacterized protein n=1 Tax=Oculimacula yallundae TaxID=86028 RepID=A0ABR4CER4_9HELO
MTWGKVSGVADRSRTSAGWWSSRERRNTDHAVSLQLDFVLLHPMSLPFQYQYLVMFLGSVDEGFVMSSVVVVRLGSGVRLGWVVVESRLTRPDQTSERSEAPSLMEDRAETEPR